MMSGLKFQGYFLVSYKILVPYPLNHVDNYLFPLMV